ncbi:MAG: HDOD domain-containing protein [Dehalococcoidia bacterium]
MTLPTLPAAHARALSMLAKPDVDISELASIVESDPGLTAAMLRAANSAAYSPLSRITTASDAVVRVGLSTTRRIVASAALNGAFKNLSNSGIDVDQLWSSVLATALLADAAAWAEGARTEAFTAGLLYPIGRLAMAGEQPVQYRRVVAMVHDGWRPSEAEVEVFGYDSSEWGAQVAAAWDLPENIAEAIRSQDTGDCGPLSWVVWKGRTIGWSLGYGDGLSCPLESTFDPTSDDAPIVGTVGGPDGLQSQIEWYRGSLGMAA